MNEYPSSDFMHKIYNGLKLYVFAPIIIYLLVLLIATVGINSKEIILLFPILTLTAAIYLIYVVSRYNDDVVEYVKTFVNRLKIGVALWILSSALQIILVFTTLYIGDFSQTFLWLTIILSLAGYGVVGSGYGYLSSEGGIRGSQLTTKGFYTVVISTIAIILLALIYISIDSPQGMGWFGPSQEEIQAYQTKIAWLTVFIVLAILASLAGQFAIIFGSRFIVDSVEIFEISNSSGSTITPNYCATPEDSEPLSTTDSAPQMPQAPDSDTTKLINEDLN